MDTNRLAQLKQKFTGFYDTSEPDLLVRSPGRIEILGNHTDYNNGYALAGAISRSIYFAFKKRSDRQVRCYSTSFPDLGVQVFDMDAIDGRLEGNWLDYVKGVIWEMRRRGLNLEGADILLDSTLPCSGGLSSSAALELGIAHGFASLHDLPLTAMEQAMLCKQAENNYVKSPCGFLDQAAVALPLQDQMLWIDFKPMNDGGYRTERVAANFENHRLQFVLAVDPSVKRNLAATGYPARRKMCEDSLPFWSEKLGRPISALRDVSVEDFQHHERSLETIDPAMARRVKHIVHENQRVQDGVAALKGQDIETFGRLLTASGISAMDLYELAEGVPQLSDLVALAPTLSGVVGARNMGGGFSVVVLALVKSDRVADYEKAMANFYQQRYPEGKLEFIAVTLINGTETLMAP